MLRGGSNGRLWFAGGLLALALAAPASAAVTVGELAPGTITSCSSASEFLQHSSPGNTHVMPAAGTITSWAHRSQTGAGQEPTLKIFRKTADPSTYQVVGRDGPHPINANTTESFPASVEVKAGDVLGLTGAGGANIGCYFQGTSGVMGARSGNLADGAFENFALSSPDVRVNVAAVLDPTNTFTLGKVGRNKKKGTATLTVDVPNPGELVASGKGAKVAAGAVISKAVAGPGAVKLTIRATGKKKKALSTTGKVKLNLTITFTPTGGDPSTQSRKLKLKKNL